MAAVVTSELLAMTEKARLSLLKVVSAERERRLRERQELREAVRVGIRYRRVRIELLSCRGVLLAPVRGLRWKRREKVGRRRRDGQQRSERKGSHR